jgi:hypothetical protein
VALLFAFVDAAIELTLAEVAAFEHASPAFDNWLVAFDDVFTLALLLISAITAE